MRQIDKDTMWNKPINPDRLGSWDFKDGEIKKLTIERIFIDQVFSPDKAKAEPVYVAKFLEAELPMILNKTNRKKIHYMTGIRDMADWGGVAVWVKVEHNIRFGPNVTDGLRVDKAEAPGKTLPELTPDHPKWLDAVAAVKSGKTTVDKIRQSYSVSDDNAKLMTSDAN